MKEDDISFNQTKTKKDEELIEELARTCFKSGGFFKAKPMASVNNDSQDSKEDEEAFELSKSSG